MGLDEIFVLALAIVAVVAAGVFAVNATEATEATEARNSVAVPDFIHICQKDDPEMDTCVGVTISRVVKRLTAGGIPELDVLGIEPLYMEEITALDIAGLRLRVSDIVAHGIGSLKMTGSRGNLETREFYHSGEIARVEITANFELVGMLLFLPVQMAGSILITTYDIVTITDGKYKLISKSGTDFMAIDTLTFDLQINDMSAEIFNQGFTGEMINRILNYKLNKRVILSHITPIIENTIQGILVKFGTRIFSSVPFKVLFPETKRTDNLIPPSVSDSHEDPRVSTKFAKKALVQR